MAAIAAYLLVAGSFLEESGSDVAVYVPGQPKQLQLATEEKQHP